MLIFWLASTVKRSHAAAKSPFVFTSSTNTCDLQGGSWVLGRFPGSLGHGRVEIWWSNKEPESTLCWGGFSEKIGVFRKLRLMCVWCACNCSKVSSTFVRDQRSMMWFCKRVWIRVGNLPDIHQHWQKKSKSHASSLHSVFFEKNSPYFVL